MSYTIGTINDVNIMITSLENGISSKIYTLNTSDGNIMVIDNSSRYIFTRCLNCNRQIKLVDLTNLENDNNRDEYKNVKKPKFVNGLRKNTRDTNNISAIFFMDGQHANMTNGVLAFIDDKQIE